MPPRREQDWSDSDEEPESGLETSVLLGVPDGPVSTTADMRDAAVSRIGGHPALLPFNEPSFSSSHCKNCSNPMELLVQLWCPFEDSPMDRALYVWGCSRNLCQRKAGSVRAWRGLRINTDYAAQLAKKSVQKGDEKKNENSIPKPNPFSKKSSLPAPIGLGSQIFGEKSDVFANDNESNETASDDDDDALVTAMASVTIENSEWALAPSYPAIYLSTVTEFLPPVPTSNTPASARIQDPAEGKDTSWALESYENSLNIDPVFETFSRRVGYQGEQCVRYELNGKPLPFSTDKVFDQLFPLPVSPTIQVTKAAFAITPPLTRTYQPTAIPPCPFCGSKRVFECQLMPNLINVLARDNAKTDNQPGMEWGVCLIFSCEKDCCDESECWREEIVLVQWDE